MILQRLLHALLRREAAFTHLNPNGSRFSDGSYGVYYAAREQETAIYETVYHAERFLRDSREAPIEQDMRVYIAPIEGDLHDLRGEDPQTSSLLLCTTRATMAAHRR